MTPLHRSLRDPRRSATVISRSALLYSEGPDATLDRPAHVRAGSGLCWMNGHLAVVQDDALFLALVDPTTGRVASVTLPSAPDGIRQFDDNRGNKSDKPDLEACFSVPTADGDILFGFGSGATERRTRIVRISSGGTASLHPASRLYAEFMAQTEFSGSELNIEGVVWLSNRIRLFNRGNGAQNNGLQPVNASCDIDWQPLEAYLESPENADLPDLARIVHYDLGALENAPLSFTDACWSGGQMIYSASAELSLNTVSDGQVIGSAIGALDEHGQGHWIEIRHPDGSLFREKIEGICARPDQPDRLYAVLDADEPGRPSELCDIALIGFG